MFNFLNYKINILKSYIYYWGLGSGDWGLGIGDWGLGDRKSVV